MSGLATAPHASACGAAAFPARAVYPSSDGFSVLFSS
jgi:hypothetical protein